jgi:hypothetical protein
VTPVRTITVRGWLGLILSAGLCAIAWVTAYRWQPFTLPPADDLPALAAERDSLCGNEDAARDALRAQAKESRIPAWSEQALAALPGQFGTGWGCDRQADESEVRMQVWRQKPHLDEWPEYLAFVERWSRAPGVSVESVEIRAEGGAQDRRLTRVAIGLRFLRDDATTRDAVQAAPSPQAAVRTASPRRIVRPRPGQSGPSLRSTAPEPPPSLRPPGAASASFRPDPPGSQAGS